MTRREIFAALATGFAGAVTSNAAPATTVLNETQQLPSFANLRIIGADEGGRVVPYSLRLFSQSGDERGEFLVQLSGGKIRRVQMTAEDIRTCREVGFFPSIQKADEMEYWFR